MIIQNFFGKSSKVGCIVLCTCFLFKMLLGRNLFLPLEEYKSEWTLISLDPIPFQVQYHGTIKLPNGKEKYIFLINGRCVYAYLEDLIMDQFVLKQVSDNGESVILQDRIEGTMYTLKLGETCYRPECFCGKILDKISGKCYNFSHKNSDIFVKGLKITLSVKSNDYNSVWVNVFQEGKLPFSYVLHKN